MDQWIPVRRFSADQDLTSVILFLRDRGVAHRVSEAAGEQLLSVSDERVIEPLTQFLDSLARGDIQLERSEIPVSRVDQAVSRDLPLAQQLQLFPVVFVALVACTLGYLCVEFFPQWLRVFTFLDITLRGYVPFSASWANGEYWRLITPTFLHFGITHYIFNGIMLWWLGQRLERMQGHLPFLIFIVVTGVAANIAQYLWTSSGNFGGISGVIYAFVGYVLVYKWVRPQAVSDIQTSLLVFMLVWLVFCMTGIVDLFMSGGVANAAHLGGLAAGVLYGLLSVLFTRMMKK